MKTILLSQLRCIIPPNVFRQVAAGARKGLKAPLSTWTSYLWRISDWYLEA